MGGGKNMTIPEKIRANYSNLTRKERKFADVLLSNYPVAGLASITDAAQSADVSTPTVLRTAKKLGFDGYTSFQVALRAELEETLKNPIAKRKSWSEEAPETHFLNQFANAVTDNLSGTLRQIDHRQFDAVSALLCDMDRKVSIVGGRLTHAVAEYFATHLSVIRPDVTMLPGSSSQWPHYFLDAKKNDILVIFDVRRYEANLSDLAKIAANRKISIVLFTDQWMSPISAHADHVLPVRIEVPSGWDSSVVSLFLVEALIGDIENRCWGQAKKRLKELEGIFDATKRFLKKP